MDQHDVLQAERPRLLRIAARILGDDREAEDVVQAAWFRLERNRTPIENLPGWLTTVTTRLCLDHLRQRTPVPDAEVEPTAAHDEDPAHRMAQADAVGQALQVVLDRLSPTERVAFVLHDSFGFEFGVIAEILDTTPAAARKLASRARTKLPDGPLENRAADWAVVDAFLEAARKGEFERLLQLLAPDVVVAGDAAAVAMGTPTMTGRQPVAEFFNGAAKAARSVFIGERAGAAWIDGGRARVAFDFTVTDGEVTRIEFRADPGVLAEVRRRRGDQPA